MPRSHLLTLLLMVPWVGAPAQQLAELAPGARVRIEAPGVVAGRYSGTVLSRTPDTVVVASSAASIVRVPVSSLTSEEVSRGKSRSRGAMNGVPWGAGVGLVFGLLTSGVSGDAGYGSKGEYLAFNVAAGAIWGALIGAIAGAERWDSFHLPRRTSLLLPVAPDRGGLAVRLVVEH